MFKLKFLPATIGDSIWVSYGDPQRPHHFLVDGGTRGTRKHIQDQLMTLPEQQRQLELIVVSHIDKDHIGGILTLLQKEEVDFKFDDLWFNAFRHLPEPEDGDDILGALQGEQLSKILDEKNYPWNEAFGCRGQKAVVIPNEGPLPQVTLAGGMKLTLLSPLVKDLMTLRGVWEKEVKKAEIKPGEESLEDEPEGEDEELGIVQVPNVAELAASVFRGDRSPANGSSISFIAEFDGKRVLFAADAHAGKLWTALERASPGKRLPLDVFKISHHGSKTTTSRKLIKKVECPSYVFSTKGSIFKHPNGEAVARVITVGGDSPLLVFNYRQPTNEIWDLDQLKQQYGYTTRYPAAGKEGIEIDV